MQNILYTFFIYFITVNASITFYQFNNFGTYLEKVCTYDLSLDPFNNVKQIIILEL